MAEDEIELNESEIAKEIDDTMKQATADWEKRMAGAKSNTLRTVVKERDVTPFELLADAMSALRNARREVEELANRLVGETTAGQAGHDDYMNYDMATVSFGLLNDIATTADTMRSEIAIIMGEIARIREKV